jgi:zinc/manganese transport system substrate-binding protein
MRSRTVTRTTIRLALAVLCGVAGTTARADLTVFTCEAEWAALAEELGGEHVTAEAAVAGTQDMHYLQARPSLIAKVRNADLVVCTGADLEVGWLPLLLRQANNPAVQPGNAGFMAASDYVGLLEKPEVVDRALGDIHPFGNPHIQTDPRNIASVADVLAERLAQLDAANAAYYAQRHTDFASRWQTAIERWTGDAAPLRGMAIVTHHKSWVYMIDWLGLREIGTLEPKPGVPPTTSHLAQLLGRLENENVRVIVRSAYENSRGSMWLSDRANIPAAVLPHTIGSVDGVDDLFSLFDVLIARLLEYRE